MANSSRNLLADTVRSSLTQHLFEPSLTKCVVAYSGGMDSHVLLHLCHQMRLDVSAIHINHQLQSQADDWQQHCVEVCQQLDIEIECIRVDAVADRGESPEAAAREARYQALYDTVQADEILLLAQHRDDQAETVLLQLLRGAGAAGLSAMPESSRRENARGETVSLMRPMLSCSREQIQAYAEHHALTWVEDPSNTDTSYRRNAVRHELMPHLEVFDGSVVQQLCRVAEQQQSSTRLLDELAQMDRSQCETSEADQLNISLFEGLSVDRQFNLLRFWLSAQGARPNRDGINQILSDVLTAAEDATPVVRWGDHEVRRFDRRLYLMRRRHKNPSQERYNWLPKESALPLTSGRQLAIEQDIESGLDNRYLDEELIVGFRQGGERIRLIGKQHHQELKKLLQSSRVPPWERDQIPLLYHNDELIAVGDRWLSAEHCVDTGQRGWCPCIR